MKTPQECLTDLTVSVYQGDLDGYPDQGPFSPSQPYPEYPFQHLSDAHNGAYHAVREALAQSGADRAHYGSPQWNPLGDVVRPGDHVVVNPNFVLSYHAKGGDLFSIITHPSVLRAVVDYVYLALKGKGRITIADAPQMDCDFSELLKRTQLETITELYREAAEFPIDVLDLRNFWYDKRATQESTHGSGAGFRHRLPGDPRGAVLVNLGKESLFYGKDSQEYYGADFDREKTIRHHRGETHEYLVSKTVLSADVVVLVPKLKVHKKVGATLNIKGLVGINTDKNCLVHYTLGTPAAGGDQFPDRLLTKREALRVKLQRWAYDVFLSRKTVWGDRLYRGAGRLGRWLLRPWGVKMPAEKTVLDCGNWYGNDSAWRMSIDLFRLFLYADASGTIHSQPVRRVFSVVDGIVGGENDGPLAPDGKSCGLIVAGSNLAAVDLACLQLMGLDFRHMKTYQHILAHPHLYRTAIGEISVRNNNGYSNLFQRKDRLFDFKPHPGWVGHLEKQSS